MPDARFETELTILGLPRTEAQALEVFVMSEPRSISGVCSGSSDLA